MRRALTVAVTLAALAGSAMAVRRARTPVIR